MPSFKRSKPEKASSEPSSLRSSELRRVSRQGAKKFPVISLFLENNRSSTTMEGAKLLKEASDILKEIKDKLDPDVWLAFDERLRQYVCLVTGTLSLA
jgi:hypothetical protein